MSAAFPGVGPTRLVVVTPVYNDAASFDCLCRELGKAASQLGVALVIRAVDDGSAVPNPIPLRAPPGVIRVEMLRLVCNLGHQRAIAVGLADLVGRIDFDAVVVMDCDGEDRPSDLRQILAAHASAPASIVAARRAKRSEGPRFRIFYGSYKGFFALCTGRRIDFGNFMLLPRTAVQRIAYMPELWNHLAAAALRSRLPIVKVSCDRGRRYAGHSSMNLVSLLAHGLSAVAVFSDLVFVRLLVLAGGMFAVGFTLALGAVVVRLATDLAIPGWASTVVGFGAILLFQALTLSVVTCLTMLASRSSAAFVPANHAGEYVAERSVIESHDGTA